jgi:POT family proton-dependent oligopeptide transporter
MSACAHQRPRGDRNPAGSVAKRPCRLFWGALLAVTRPPVHSSDAASSVWTFFRDRRFVTLFMTDIWERFSFFGMQALLFVYAIAPASAGGLGLGAGQAGTVFGLYMAIVFVCSLPGGWAGDRLFGSRRAILYGALSIAAGHYLMAVPAQGTFVVGLGLIAAGTGLVKPNMPELFRAMYPKVSSSRREAAFSLFYMSIQVSALVAPIATGWLGERVNWHLGFGLAALGMTLGVLQYAIGQRHYGPEGGEVPNPLEPGQRYRLVLWSLIGVSAGALLFVANALTGAPTLDHMLMFVGLVVLVSPFAYMRHLMRRPEVDADGRRRIGGMLWVLLPSAMFWMLYSQLGSTFSLFAATSTDRVVFGFEIPVSWFQSASPLFLLMIAPLAALVWVRLGDSVGSVRKLTSGMVFAGLSMLVVAIGAAGGGDDGLVSPLWLLLAFLLFVAGEINFGPVGLNLMAEVAPAGFGSRMMGLYYLFAALGAMIGGQLSRLVDVLELHVYFGSMAAVAAVVSVLMFIGARRLAARLQLRTRA